MKKTVVMVMGMLLSVASMNAQTIYDAAQISEKDLNGTARFVGMGGAMSALGGDISTISTNPAGIGIFRSSDVMTTFGVSAYNAETSTVDGKYKFDNTRADFNNIGLVLSTHVGNKSSLRYVNFGFNYKRAKSFYRNTESSGVMNGMSQAFYMAWQASGAGVVDGITDWSGNPYTKNDIGWLSALGYQSYMINPGITTTITNFPYNDENGSQYVDSNGNPLYLDYDYYTSPASDTPVTSLRTEERGGVDQFDFNMAFNFNDRFYLGFTVGAYSVNYKKSYFYSESYDQTQGYSLSSSNKVTGAGFDFKVGTIIRPFEESPFRVGLSIHTPTFYDLEYRTTADISSVIYDSESGSMVSKQINTSSQLRQSNGGNGVMVREFQLQTPWIFNLSLGSTFGTQWAVDAEYEYEDYTGLKFRDPEGYSDTFSFENSTRDMMKGVSTIRLGAEYKPIPEFAIRAGYNYRTAIFKNDAYKDLPYYSIQTDTDFSNTQSMNTVTLGFGYRGAHLYADLAYKYSSYKADLYPFVNIERNTVYSAAANKSTYNRSQALVTIGYRF